MENIQEKLDELKELIITQSISQKEILTLKEAAEYLNLSASALYKMTSNKEIPFYCPGGKKIYFMREELKNWVLSGKVSSAWELESEVDSYLKRTNKNLVS